jgi:sorting nexin-8
LRRYINTIVNHPVTKDDGALNVFLTEPNFEAWRKRVKVSTDEESSSKKLNPAQEMAIPADLETRLTTLRQNLPAVLSSYQKLVLLAERGLLRLQSSAADASRFALGLQAAGESIPGCCHHAASDGQACALCRGVASGLGEVSESWTRLAEQHERRATALLEGSIEDLKDQRDLYLAFRDLFIRYDRQLRHS